LQHSIDLRIQLRHSTFSVGDLTRTGQYLREAESASMALGDMHRACRVGSLLTHCLWITGAHAEARATGERALADAQALASSDLEFLSRYFLGYVYHATGSYRQAIGHF
jgi:hypothetical protein